jgi:ABC-2 type transport system permease protein
MTLRTARATATRVLRQLLGDRRTLALLLVVPCLLITLVRFVFDKRESVFQTVGLPLIGIFPLTSMFLVASISMLRERRSGTLERLMAGPATKLGILAGYATAFAAVATVQAVLTLLVGVGLLGLDVAGPLWFAFVVAIANALAGMALGLLLSAFANTEFQAVQFMPAFIFPQFLLCGLFAARSTMAQPLRLASAVMPITYAYDALHQVATNRSVTGAALRDLLVMLIICVLALCLGAVTLRRRTP